MAQLILFGKPVWRGILLGLSCALAAWLLSRTSFIQRIEDRQSDECFRWRGTRPSSSHIVIIDLDNSSLEELGDQPVSPDLARVVRHVHKQGAAAIGIDLYVPQYSSRAPADNGDSQYRSMGLAVREAGNVVLPLWQDDKLRQAPLEWRLKALDPTVAAPTDLAFVNLTTDRDQVIRRQLLLAHEKDDDENDVAVPQFAFALYLVAHGKPLVLDDTGQPLLDGRPLPLEPDETLRINYVGPPRTFELLPFQRVLEAARAEEALPLLEGAVVIIGGTAPVLKDEHPSPFDNQMSGVELHANILATLEDRAFIRTPAWLEPHPVLLVLGCLLGCWLLRLRLLWGLLLVIGVVIGWKLLSVAGFNLFAYRIQVLPIVLLCGIMYPGAIIHTARVRQQGRRKTATTEDDELFEEAGSRLETVVFSLVTEAQAFSEQTVVVHYPSPITLPYRRFCRGSSPHQRVEALFCTVEAVLRYLVTLGVSDLFHCLARQDGKATDLPDSRAFDFLRVPTDMTLGKWLETLRETARHLQGHADRYIQELPLICAPGGMADRELFGKLVSDRNNARHASGCLGLSSKECRDILKESVPLLEQTLYEIRFVCSYPLGFVQPSPVGYDSAPVGHDSNRAAPVGYDSNRAIDSARLESYPTSYLFSCQGARPPQRTCILQSPVPIPQDYPFVAAQGRPRFLFLWPLLTVQAGEHSQVTSLFAFERITQENRPFFTTVDYSALDRRESLPAVELSSEPATSLAWLIRRLGVLYGDQEALPDLQVAEKLHLIRGPKLVGRKLGPNLLIECIGSGGFGKIYSARHETTGQLLAVKVLELTEDVASPEALHDQFTRFRTEFDRLNRLLVDAVDQKKPPALIRCFEWGHHPVGQQDYPWYSMEFAAGGDLAARIADRNRQLKKPDECPWNDPAMRKAIVREFLAIARAVAFLHRQDIIHRDIKPGNVLIMADGSLRLSDFGLAKSLNPSVASRIKAPRTRTGAVQGTWRYMAPEQKKGLQLTKSADVFVLGVLLAELATGQVPPPAARRQPKANATIPEKVPAQPQGSALNAAAKRFRQLPRPLRRFILICTDRDPERRPSDATTLLARFRRLMRTLEENKDTPAT